MSTATRTHDGFHHLARTFARARTSPIRVSLPLLPPQWLTIPQHRTLRLYPLLKLKNTVGAHPVLQFHDYTPPNLNVCKQRIDLYSDQTTLVAENISLQSAYDHIRPGHILYPKSLPADARAVKHLDAMRKNDVPGSYNKYIMGPPKPNNQLKGGKKGKKEGKKVEEKEEEEDTMSPAKPGGFNKVYNHYELKTIPFSGKMMTDTWLLQDQLSKAHRFLEALHPVEMQFRLPGVPARIGTRAQQNYSVAPVVDSDRLQDWDWLHSHFPHLHPRFLLKGMPPGTKLWVSPKTTGPGLYIVFGPPRVNSFGGDAKLTLVKERVVAKIQDGDQSNLPRRFREQLQDAGYYGYSTLADQQLPNKIVDDHLAEHAKLMSKQHMDGRYTVNERPKMKGLYRTRRTGRNN